MSNQFEETFNRIECSTGLIFVDTPEETRFIREVYRKFNDWNVQFWSISQGLQQIKGTEPDNFYPYNFPTKNARTGSNDTVRSVGSIQGTLSIIEEDSRKKLPSNESERTVYILRDLCSVLKNPVDIRKLKDIIYLVSLNKSSIVVTGQGLKIPPELEKDCTYLPLEYPHKEEIKNGIISNVRDIIEEKNKELSDNEKIDSNFNDEEVARACAGLTEDQIINVLEYTISIYNKVDLDVIMREKKSIINKSDLLEYWDCDDTLDEIGGFGEFKDWVKISKSVIDHADDAAKFGADPPKAIMLIGTQGTGKTAICKALAQSLKMSLIKFQVDKVFAGLVGQSESNMRRALSQIEAAGGVVVIDEIDKALSGAGSSDRTDGGTTSRVIGSFLTWLQKDHPGVFLAVTANDITAMRNNHPELLRKGRFDEIWFSDVPTYEERKEIFKIHLKKKNRSISKFDLDKLSSVSYIDDTGKEFQLSGAEIESAVKDAIREKFSKSKNKKIKPNTKNDITTNDIIRAAKNIKPITKIAKETITRMRKWSLDNARNVSKKEDKKEKSNTKSTSSSIGIRSKNIKL